MELELEVEQEKAKNVNWRSRAGKKNQQANAFACGIYVMTNSQIELNK